MDTKRKFSSTAKEIFNQGLEGVESLARAWEESYSYANIEEDAQEMKEVVDSSSSLTFGSLHFDERIKNNVSVKYGYGNNKYIYHIQILSKHLKGKISDHDMYEIVFQSTYKYIPKDFEKVVRPPKRYDGMKEAYELPFYVLTVKGVKLRPGARKIYENYIVNSLLDLIDSRLKNADKVKASGNDTQSIKAAKDNSRL